MGLWTAVQGCIQRVGLCSAMFSCEALCCALYSMGHCVVLCSAVKHCVALCTGWGIV